MFKLNRRGIHYSVIFVLFSLHAMASETKMPGAIKPAVAKPSAVKTNKTSSLTIHISNVKPNKGSLRVVLWNNKKFFTKTNKMPYRYFRFPAKNEKAEVTFTGLIPGEKVSIFIHQDLNNSGRMSTNFLRIPTDPYQFGNNSRKSFSKPKYEDTTVTIGEKTTVHHLTF